MRRVTALIFIVVLAVIVAAAGIVVLKTRDLDAYRSEIARRLSLATGRDIAIEGPLRLDLGLSPTLSVERVTIGNIAKGSRPAMATVGRIELAVGLLPLLSGELRIDRLVLTGADILLERNAAGRGNWQLGPGSADEGGDGGLPALGEVRLRRSNLVYRGKEHSYDIDIKDISLLSKGEGGPLLLTGRLALDGRPLSLSAELEIGADRYALRNLKLGFAGSDLGGALALSLDGERPLLTGALDSTLLDVNALAPAPPADEAASDGRLFSDAALPREPFTMVDAELGFTGDRVLLGPLDLRDVGLTLRLREGRLSVKSFAARLAGGRLGLQAVLDARRPVLAVEASGSLAQADFGALMRRVAESELFTGKLDAELALAGRGRSLRELVAGAGGKARLVITEGSVDNRYLDYLAADLVRLLVPDGGGGETTAINCFIADYAVEQGVARSRVTLLDTDRMIMAGEGTIDLGHERIDLYLKPRPKDPSLLSLATPVIVSGPLTRPGARPDPAALGKSAAIAILGGVLIPGAGVLLPFLDAGAGDHHPCRQAIEDAGAAVRVEASDGRVEGVLGDIGQGIGRGISRGLKSIGSLFGGGS